MNPDFHDDIRNVAVIFLAELGAPASLYHELLQNLEDQFPEMKLVALEWWKFEDFGFKVLNEELAQHDAILIGHGAGGVVALQALSQALHLVKKVILLDTHPLHKMNPLPTVDEFMHLMLDHDAEEIKSLVSTAYAPVIKNSESFYKGLQFLINWTEDALSKASNHIKLLPKHSVLHVGFTNSNHQPLEINDEIAQEEMWGAFAVDVKFMPMHHFDLIDRTIAEEVSEIIYMWLNETHDDHL